MFEFTSNGQTLSSKIRSQMLGKSIRVYISMDSATSGGFKRYRDHRFNLIVDNLRSLCAERKDHNNLPEVVVSFIVMKSNVDEISDF